MLKIDIPDSRPLQLHHRVLDFNGTIAKDGEVLPDVRTKLSQLSQQLDIHVITADTHGTVMNKLAGYPLKVSVIDRRKQDRAKQKYLEILGPDSVVAMGNGRNDGLMLARAVLGIGLIQAEGAAAAVMTNADVLCTDIHDALNLLIHTKRLQATLRN